MEGVTQFQMQELADCRECKTKRFEALGSSLETVETMCEKHMPLVRYILMLHNLRMIKLHLRRIQELSEA